MIYSSDSEMLYSNNLDKIYTSNSKQMAPWGNPRGVIFFSERILAIG